MDFRALPPQRRQGIGRSHAGLDTWFGKRRSDRFAIFCQSLQLLGETDRSFHLGFPFRLRQPGLELCRKIGDGVNQAADLISATASIPSLNFIPLTTFGNWF